MWFFSFSIVAIPLSTSSFAFAGPIPEILVKSVTAELVSSACIYNLKKKTELSYLKLERKRQLQEAASRDDD